MMTEYLFGTDHASHQGRLTASQWGRMHAEAGLSFTICKATGEGSYFNPTYFPNRDAVRQVPGLAWGSYDWMEPSEMSDARPGEVLARDYLAAIGPRDQGHLLMVDFESNIWDTGPLGKNIEEHCRRYFLTLSEEADQLVGVYAGPYFFRETGALAWDWLGDPTKFYLWIAAPGPSEQAKDDAPWPGGSPPFPVSTFHQHQWHANFASIGVPGEWDRNRFKGTAADLARYGYGGKQMPNTVPLPPDGKWSADVTPEGKPYFIWNVGGKTTPDGIVGANIQDIGMTVKSATEPGVVIDRSIQQNVVQPFNPPRPAI